MKTKYFNLEVIGLFMLSLIPWPAPSVYKISCPRESARVVRKVVGGKWAPVLDRFRVQLPLECPFHPARDIYAPQQAAKHQHRASQWTCGLCGKSFFEERHLDAHFDNRHKDSINTAEDAVCLADYCDIMRCEVLLSQDALSSAPTAASTDIEIWREATAYRTALTASGPRDLARLQQSPHRQEHSDQQQQYTATDEIPKCSTEETADRPEDEGREQTGDGSNLTKSSRQCKSDLVDSTLPPVSTGKHRRQSELQRLKANCQPDELRTLRLRCEILIRDCIAGLLVQLSTDDFKTVEEELNQAVCWYLTCDRYWEDSAAESRTFPWGLLFLTIMVLSLGLCLCYYIIWVLFDTDDGSVSSTSASVTAPSSPAHHSHHGDSGGPMGSAHVHDGAQQPGYSEEYYKDLGQNEHYIYVTYPPELKRRLLES